MSIGETRDPEKIELERKLKRDVEAFLASKTPDQVAMGKTAPPKSPLQSESADRSRRRAAGLNRKNALKGKKRAKPTRY